MNIPISYLKFEEGRKIVVCYLTSESATKTGLPSRIVGRGRSRPGAIADWTRRMEFERCGLIVEVTE